MQAPCQDRGRDSLQGVLSRRLQVQTELQAVSKTDNSVQSFARVQFHPECEAAVNEQIK
jgi:hypothetical protein